MSYLSWLVLCSLVIIFIVVNGEAQALTPEEVLKLKASGVSEETIQLMLQNEKESKISVDKLEQGYATEHMGTWKLRDGRTITSTGKRQRPLHYPTEYPPPAPYAPYIYPYVNIPAENAWRRSAPTPLPQPETRETPVIPPRP